MNIDDDFWRGILLKLAFKPDKVRSVQAALLYVALTGQTFTADCLPPVLKTDNTTAGCAVKTLAEGKFGLGFITFQGWVTSPAKSRHGAPVKSWRLADGRRALVCAWLEANGFEAAVMATQQQELAV